ncbi:hypothetical protein FSARC_1830 [Fusarium sarcochroum]|uniref:L-tyrosine decarboxylase C-terminal domain-containing protein n=1 Tax=Fusarium sarcochroum TaxID=1208366 RepID=A0A8H4XEI7_9HYPO|nr:hypothetical protein FSARC_1830 [Fusarium sarcochroum]
MSDVRQDEFDRTHAYFIGPKGSNLPDFRANINTILDELLTARQSYYPEDQAFISKEYRRSPVFLKARSDLRLATEKVAQLLGEHSAPFWSPRYEAHMCTDLTMSSLLGYFMTMLYNPNNVALEASPMTTLVELRVGQQLCKLFGYNIDAQKSPVSWGHITCDGTIANLESIWVGTYSDHFSNMPTSETNMHDMDVDFWYTIARNLKFYPLSLSLALQEKGKLNFIGDKFFAPSSYHSSEKKKKLFKDLEAWDLFNIRPEVILDLPDELNKQFGITSKFLESALNEFNIQTIGRAALEKKFKIEKPARYFVSKTRHYSWPKGAAIAGLGSANVIGVDVNNSAQIDMKRLERHLEYCVKEKIAVYAVVAVIGSTEEGAVDRLTEILRLRKKFQEERGLSFLVHADAAWGGYFATMVNPDRRYSVEEQTSTKPEPEWYLDPKTVEDIKAMADADSITVDPHKAGYIPYPAGSLVYRDGRMRHLVTWSGPYLSQGSAENIGVYGVEGSKPGAAAMSAWFSNQTIGLNHRGYGKLLGEATFTSARLSAHYATMINEDFICVPFNMLPAENHGNKAFLSPAVKKQREKISDLIIGKDDKDIFASKDAMKIIRDLGSDTNINAFALNWIDADGKLNTDLEEANYLMKRVVNRLSITSANTDPSTIPIFLTSTEFSHDDYGACAHKFMERMGVEKSDQNLFVIRNVVMSPFPTRKNFILTLMNDLEKVIKEEVEVCRKRNNPDKKVLQFLAQGSPGTSDLFLVFQASFHSATRRQQVILSATPDAALQAFHKEATGGDQQNQDSIVMLESQKPILIEEVIKNISASKSYQLPVVMYEKGIKKYSKEKGTITFKAVVKSRPLNSIHRDIEYPDKFMPFYLYGTEQEMHISHMLVKSPNIALSASNVEFEPSLSGIDSEDLAKGLILGLSEIPEASMQPFAEKNRDLSEQFFFRQYSEEAPEEAPEEGQDGSEDKDKEQGQEKGQEEIIVVKKEGEFEVKIWKDPKDASAKGPGLLKGLGDPLYEGKLLLRGNVFVDAEGPNEDKLKDKKIESDSWQKKLDEIGSVLDGTHTCQG